jgi:DNA segregation ATPase FtsK/SpoIIIE, S-DNA-T family
VIVNNPGVRETLARLDALKGAIRDFAAREAKLNGELHAQATAVARLDDEAVVKRTESLAAGVERENASFEAGKTQHLRDFESRKARIIRAHAAVRKRMMDEIGEQHGKSKYKIQASTVEADRQRDEALAATVVTLEEFRNRAGSSDAALQGLTAAARRAFSGCGKFRRRLSPNRKWPEPDLSPDENQLFAQQEQLQEKVRCDLERFGKLPLPKIFRFLPILLVTLVLLGGAGALVLAQFGVSTIPQPVAGLATGVSLLVVAVYWFALGGADPLAKTIAGDLAKARRLLDASSEKAETRYVRDQERVRAEFENIVRDLNQAWRHAVRGAMELRGARPVSLDEKAGRAARKCEQLYQVQLKRFEREHADNLARLRDDLAADAAKFAEGLAAKKAKFEADLRAQWRALENEWRNAVQPIYEKIRDANAAAEKDFTEWNSNTWKSWTPPIQFKNAAKFGRLEVDVEKFAETLPKDPRLGLPGPAAFSVPLALTYPLEGSILFETNQGGEAEAIAAINNIIFRLLSATPPGKVSFTILDPVGLGQNFAALMHLADYEEGTINSRIWTQAAQFEEKLAELTEHMEKVIQMYLRNEFATIADYNAQAGSIAEKYHFLVIASFPVNFSDVAARRLRNIASNGARCGVYTLIHWDQRNSPPNDFVPDEMRKNSVRLARSDNHFYLAEWREPGIRLVLDPAPPPEFATQFLHEVGASSKGSARVEVPFEQVAPPDGKMWSEETTEELRVPIGRSGATKFQFLEIGRGTRQHALIAGKTGSGKSTLFHIIITNLALWSSPEEVEFYLVDFKKGVEFKCYASRRLPHAKVVAIESDRAFGLSVLQRVDEELRRRGDLFRQLGVQDLAGYRKTGGQEAMPRALLLIDEFQEFFTEEDHRASRPGVWHSCDPGLANTRRRLHAGTRDHRPDGHPHRAPMQRSRCAAHHGPGQSRAAAAHAAGRGHLQ